ncbi:MAG TPA: methyltransferase domain-containing protein [Myxococcota bacterium]|nr:methyltransferase domain-containing protein [Myxococcota bacterium]HQK52036.1 methyltransferase domain-containing protein [Myxococcota bacterium]
MVRTLRSIEEEARVHQVRGPGLDRWIGDAALRGVLEGAEWSRTMDFLQDGTRRVLVAGLEDGGEAALDLLRNGRFVTAVDPDGGAVESLQQRAREARCDLRLHAIACDYMKREFQAGGFDAAFFPAVLGRYNEPLVVLRKAARELRVGGRIAFRIPVRPSADRVRQVLARWPAMDRLVSRIAEGVRRVPAIQAWTEIPGHRDLLAQVGEVFRVEAVTPMHLLAPLAGTLAVAGPDPLASLARRTVPWLDRLDRVAVSRAFLQGMAAVLLVHGSKELQLGRTFQVG